MKQDIRLLIVDAQNDFCDLPESCRPADAQPALPVPGAHADMMRLARTLDAGRNGVSEIAVTLDTHAAWDIAHPPFWQRGDGGEVMPFTPITAADVRAGRFAPREPTHSVRALAYLDALEAQNRYTLMVWPVHCEANTWGNALHTEVARACADWQAVSGKAVMQVRKGMHPWTEHYSALRAEVPDPGDPGTQTNQALLDWATAAEVLIVAGEAGSHCVRATVEDIVQAWPDGRAEKLVLMRDGMSPVTGFEAAQAHFLSTMQNKGGRLMSAAAVAEMLRANANAGIEAEGN
jgi:nicotinamidase/pyrazinamidase